MRIASGATARHATNAPGGTANARPISAAASTVRTAAGSSRYNLAAVERKCVLDDHPRDRGTGEDEDGYVALDHPDEDRREPEDLGTAKGSC